MQELRNLNNNISATEREKPFSVVAVWGWSSKPQKTMLERVGGQPVASRTFRTSNTMASCGYPSRSRIPVTFAIYSQEACDSSVIEFFIYLVLCLLRTENVGRVQRHRGRAEVSAVEEHPSIGRTARAREGLPQDRSQNEK